MARKVYMRTDNGELVETVCPSTHGGSGYASGTYWDGDQLVCGICGEIIESPIPTGTRFVPDKGIRGKLGLGKSIPKYGCAGPKP